jgi:hypothetical protein
MKPEKGTYPAYFENYIPLVKEDSVLDALAHNWAHITDVLSAVQPDKENYAYAEKKWTIRQLVNHLIDTERIMAYRALRFARKDQQQPLPFDENAYADVADVNRRNLNDLIYEYDTVRKSTVSLFNSFSESILLNTGKTAGGETTVLALGYMICGHAEHHLSILRERYLKNNS